MAPLTDWFVAFVKEIEKLLSFNIEILKVRYGTSDSGETRSRISPLCWKTDFGIKSIGTRHLPRHKAAVQIVNTAAINRIPPPACAHPRRGRCDSLVEKTQHPENKKSERAKCSCRLGSYTRPRNVPFHF
jgi:hypothetical protein